MSKIRIKILLSLYFLFGTFSVYSQGPIAEVNSQLRSLFSNITPSNQDILFFYDMAAHIVPKQYYSVHCQDTTSSDIWYNLYEEMCHAAYDTSNVVSSAQIFNQAMQFHTDTICMGIIDWRYDYLIPNALDSDYYFDLDSVYTKVYCNNRSSAAFELGEVFMAAPLVDKTETMAVTFLFDSDFLFTDTKTYYNFSEEMICYVDFGDGNGERLLNATIPQTFDVRYEKSGMHYITIRLVSANTIEEKYRSISEIYVSGYNTIDAPKTEITEINGLRITEILPDCANKDGSDKYFFMLSGYNLMGFKGDGMRPEDELYKDYIENWHLDVLRKFGYTIVLVEWNDCHADIRKNAMLVAQMLDYYKCKQVGDEEFVVMAHSMGGLVGRYALAWMESSQYVPSSDCKMSKRHNTRLFITNDSPHQGVNIPLSLQWFFRELLQYQDLVDIVTDFCNISEKTKINLVGTLLDGESVQQMLLYHVDTETMNSFSPHTNHASFIQSLDALGRHPQYCKTVAMSNGSLLGLGQQNNYLSSALTPGSFRNANDTIVDLNGVLYFDFLGFRWNVNIDVLLQTNPQGSGNLGEYRITKQVPRLRIIDRRLLLVHENREEIYRKKIGTNLISYCVAPGGNIYYSQDAYNSLLFPLGVSWFYGTYVSGDIGLNVHCGLPWLLGAGATSHLHTDGLGFGFVPIQSALDYQYGTLNLYENYETLNKSTLFARTPFDVVIGKLPLNSSARCNDAHSAIINLPTSSPLYQLYPQDTSYILNNIIGDENLWLDNMYKPWSATYSSAGNLYVNKYHPDIEYSNGTYNNLIPSDLRAYSRASDFYSNSSTSMLFVAPNEIMEGDYCCNYTEDHSALIACSNHHMPRSSSLLSDGVYESQLDDAHSLWNNNDNSLQFISNPSCRITQVQLFSASGTQLYNYVIEEAEEIIDVSLPIYDGLIFVMVTYCDGSYDVFKVKR